MIHLFPIFHVTDKRGHMRYLGEGSDRKYKTNKNTDFKRKQILVHRQIRKIFELKYVLQWI